MKTASFTIDKALGMGLRTRDGARNSGRLFELLNARPMNADGKAWLEPLQPITDPFGSQYSLNWPFPQLIKGKKFTFLCDESSVGIVNTNTWEVLNKVLYNVDSDSTTDSITGSGIWHLADGFDSYMLFNGTDMIYRDGRFRFSDLSIEDRVRVQDDVTVGTGCYHRGRFILGGFDEDNFWSRWTSQLATLQGMLPSGIDLNPEISENTVFWSSIGGGDALLLIYPTYYNSTDFLDGAGYDSTDKYLYDILKRNEIGWMPMPWQGRVRYIIPVGKALVVCGDEGISALNLFNQDGLPPSYGLIEIPQLGGVGIAGRGAGCSNEVDIVLVDQYKYLWHINGQMQPERLGYREFFKDMNADDIRITHDPVEGEFYIGDGSVEYILGRNGLYRTNQIVSEVCRIAGELNGIAVESGQDELMVGIDAFDMLSPGLKHIQEVSLGTDLTGFNTLAYVAIDYKYTQNEEWRRTEWFQCNEEGTCFPSISANQFRVIARIYPYTSTNVDYITIWYQLEDRRFVRGFSVNVANSANS